MKNFFLSLYAFHLRQILTNAPGQVASDAPLLWENLAKLGEESLPFAQLKDLQSNLICYQNGNYSPKGEEGQDNEWLTHSQTPLDLGSIPTEEGFKIDGNLQPFHLNDTYAIELALSPESPDIEIDVLQLKYFKPGCLLPSSIQASLGQTLWLYGEVDDNENCAALAKKCAVALLAGTPLDPVLINKDELFGSFLFEYRVTEPDEPQNPVKQAHILVSLNNSQANTPQKAGEAYDWLLNLLCCRHKILYVHQQARNRYPKARELYSNLEQQMQDFPSSIADSNKRLDNLKNLLATMPQHSLDYTRCLRDLKAHQTAITTNIINYRTCLKNIREIGDSPQCWQDFLRTCRQWQIQIKTDIDYLSPAQELFGQMVNTVRGMVGIEQAQSDRLLQQTIRDKEEAEKERDREQKEREQKRDRQLQITILAVGAGVSAGSIVASSSAHVTPENPLLPLGKDRPLHPFTLSVFFSILFGIAFGFAVYAAIETILSRRH